MELSSGILSSELSGISYELSGILCSEVYGILNSDESHSLLYVFDCCALIWLYHFAEYEFLYVMQVLILKNKQIIIASICIC